MLRSCTRASFIDVFRPLTYAIQNSFCLNSFPGFFRSSIISWSLKWKIFLVNGKGFFVLLRSTLLLNYLLEIVSNSSFLCFQSRSVLCSVTCNLFHTLNSELYTHLTYLLGNCLSDSQIFELFYTVYAYNSSTSGPLLS